MKKIILTFTCLILALFARNTGAAVLYWDPEAGATATAANLAGTWNTTSAQWSTTSAQTAAPTTWVSTDAACFCAGSTTVSGGFTVTVSSTISSAGLFNGPLAPPGYNVTLSGAGTIFFVAGNDALDTGGTDGDPLIVHVPISGPGTAVIEGTDQLYLEVPNTYTGGTILGYVSNDFGSIVNFTNNSFGTGSILFSNASGAAMAALGTLPITIPNGVTNLQTNINPSIDFNIVGNAAGVTFSGPWDFTGHALGNYSAQMNLSSGTATSGVGLVNISGTITGTNGFNKYGVGILELSGDNTYGKANTRLGNTYISNGWLVVANPSGSATGVSSVVITNSASPAGAGTLTGSGTVSGSVTNFGNISATNMAGGCATLTTGAETWYPGSTNIWAINKATGTGGASSGWNSNYITGSLTIKSTFTVAITSLTSANKQGAMPGANFNNTQNYSWPILTASGGISGFNAANVTIDTSKFGNALGAGVFKVSVTGNTMYVNFLQPPTVTMSPANNSYFTVGTGGTTVLTADTTGTQLSYQWTLNGGALNSADIVGSQTSSTLTINPIGVNDGGEYIVTVSNPAGSLSAQTGMVVVVPPAASAFSGTPGHGTFTLNFSGPTTGSYANYRIWSSSDVTLQPVESTWNFAGSGTFVSGGNTFTDSAANGTTEYYCIIPY